MESVIKESTSLYYEIDDCITNLIKARLDKDTNKENEAICCMESLLVSTMQNISWLVGELKGSSKIKWHIGEPKESVLYLVTKPNLRIDTNYYEVGVGWRVLNKTLVTAWCKLSDIEPYKEE